MIWAVQIHRAVLEEDLPALPKPARIAVVAAIEEKLSRAPKDFGTPLRRELFGYWKLRVGDYRVLYRIHEQRVAVLVVKVGPRKDDEVYAQMLKRIRRLLAD